jgi:hypothetical protein
MVLNSVNLMDGITTGRSGISPRILEKIRNGANGIISYHIIRSFRETDPCRKPEVENLMALSL